MAPCNTERSTCLRSSGTNFPFPIFIQPIQHGYALFQAGPLPSWGSTHLLPSLQKWSHQVDVRIRSFLETWCIKPEGVTDVSKSQWHVCVCFVQAYSIQAYRILLYCWQKGIARKFVGCTQQSAASHPSQSCTWDSQLTKKFSKIPQTKHWFPEVFVLPWPLFVNIPVSVPYPFTSWIASSAVLLHRPNALSANVEVLGVGHHSTWKLTVGR